MCNTIGGRHNVQHQSALIVIPTGLTALTALSCLTESGYNHKSALIGLFVSLFLCVSLCVFTQGVIPAMRLLSGILIRFQHLLLYLFGKNSNTKNVGEYFNLQH